LYAFVRFVEQANLPQDITVQFTGINFDFQRKKNRFIFFLELYIKNKGYVHAALELIEVSFVIQNLCFEEIILGNGF
jgi:hypothetical protein